MLNLLVASALTTHYVELGTLAGTYDSYDSVGADLEGGVSFGHSPIGAHVALGLGGGHSARDNDQTMTMHRASIGLEGRYCFGRYTCVVAGADLGTEGASGVITTGDHDPDGFPAGYHTYKSLSHAVAIPRAGIVVGGEHVAFIATVEVPRDLDGGGSRDGDGGVTGTAGVMIRW
jgi:hypothetical protein